jgi:hypothetical protein
VEAVDAGGGAFDQCRLLAELVEQRLGVGTARQLRGQRARQRRAQADSPQEVPGACGEAGEYLSGEIVGDRALVAGEGGEEPVRVVRAAQRERGQPQPGDPAVAALVQPGHLRRRQLQAGGAQQRRSVVDSEPQHVDPQLV